MSVLGRTDIPGTVYLLYGKDDELLYIGASLTPLKRLAAHKSKTWWKDVVRADFIHLPTGEQATIVEAALIEERDPLYNVTCRKWTPEEHEARLAKRRANLAALDERAREREARRAAA